MDVTFVFKHMTYEFHRMRFELLTTVLLLSIHILVYSIQRSAKTEWRYGYKYVVVLNGRDRLEDIFVDRRQY
jgi:hypothetical protein